MTNTTTHQQATYTPGHSQNATDFMSLRTLKTHGEFFLPYLKSGQSVLDCGCGPGTITLDIAAAVEPGHVVGIDFEQSQIDTALAAAHERHCGNAHLEPGDVTSLPLKDCSFDRVFSNALMEHLADPVMAMRELWRVPKPNGIVGVCSPDWGGFLLAPPSEQLAAAIKAYIAWQSKNGGDVNVGRKLGQHLAAAGFRDLHMSARYEVYADRDVIGDYLAVQLERTGDITSASTLRQWSQQDGGMFAQCWVSCVARKPAVGE